MKHICPGDKGRGMKTYLNPSILHTTPASGDPNSSHTVPHCPWWSTSTRPALKFAPPPSQGVREVKTYLNPSILHTTPASGDPNSSSHTVPHCPSWRTSTRPALLLELVPLSRTWVTVWPAGIETKFELNYNFSNSSNILDGSERGFGRPDRRKHLLW